MVLTRGFASLSWILITTRCQSKTSSACVKQRIYKGIEIVGLLIKGFNFLSEQHCFLIRFLFVLPSSLSKLC